MEDYSQINLNAEENLSKVIQNLNELNGITEEEFLMVGANLNDYKIRCKNLIEQSTLLSDELSGDVLLSKISVINSMSHDLLKNVEKKSSKDETSIELLNEIEKLLVVLGEQISGFKKIIKTLKMLSVSTLIESARLGDDAAGFNALAQDVEDLANNIEDKSIKIDAESKLLSKIISEAIGENLTLVQAQQNKVKEIVVELGNDIEVLRNKHNLKIETVSNILSDSGNINNDVSQIVTSVQFHDITRQQIEHVVNSVQNVLGMINQENISQEDLDIAIAHVRDVTNLESAQLENSNKIFFEAVDNIKNSLTDVAGNIGDISNNILEYLSDTDHQGDNFLSQLNSGLGKIITVLDESNEINLKLKESMSEIGKTVASLSNFLRLIEEIGEEVELLAINASVKAAHTGSEGAALGVIADAIQKLSSEAMEQTVKVSQPLKKITEDADQLNNDEEQLAENDFIKKEIDDIAAEMKSTIRSIEDINNNSVEGMNRLKNEVQFLQNDIKSLNNKISIHTTTENIIKESKLLLDKVSSECIKVIGENYKDETKATLNQIAERYTMLSEREIHSQINTNGKTVQTEIFEEQETEFAGNEFGDNIDLF